MKTFFLTIIMVAASFSANAQQIISGSFSALRDVKAINVEVDWSVVSIAGMTVPDWINLRQAEQMEYDAQKEYETELKPAANEFVKTANERLMKQNCYLTKDASKEFTLVIRPRNIDRKGYQTLDCAIVKTAGSEPVVAFTIEGNGGRFGSMANLWGDGFKSSGKKFAKLFLSKRK